VFIDSLSQLRYLSPDPYQFRKQVLSLLRHLAAGGATVLFTAEGGDDSSDDDLKFLSDGVIELERSAHGRICSVTKMRGSAYTEGRHHYTLSAGGMVVYPRLIPSDHTRDLFPHESLGSGVAGIDALLGGGIGRATVAVLSGPSGVGKTTLGAHFMAHAAQQGERSAIFSFEERPATFEHRLEQIGMPVAAMIASGDLSFQYLEPLHYNPDRFALLVREAVEHSDVKLVMLDSLSGYRQSVTDDAMVTRVHALTRYLVNMGVTVILINEVDSIAGGEFHATRAGISYLADAVILLRYLELDGELRKTIGVLKKRTGDFEKTLRAFDITSAGIQVGQPLHGLQGVLRGVAERTAASGPLHDTG